MKVWRSGLLLLPVLAMVALAACGGASEPSPPPDGVAGIPATSATVGPTPTQFKVRSIEAVRQYLASTGIRGKKGALTEPFDCADLPEGGAKGEYCIVDDASIYAPGLAILYIADPQKPHERVWEVRLKPNGDDWAVTEVTDVPPGR